MKAHERAQLRARRTCPRRPQPAAAGVGAVRRRGRDRRLVEPREQLAKLRRQVRKRAWQPSSAAQRAKIRSSARCASRAMSGPERELGRHDAVEHDAARMLGEAPQVVLRDAGAIRHAVEIPLRDPERRAHAIEVLHGNRRRVELADRAEARASTGRCTWRAARRPWCRATSSSGTPQSKPAADRPVPRWSTRITSRSRRAGSNAPRSCRYMSTVLSPGPPAISTSGSGRGVELKEGTSATNTSTVRPPGADGSSGTASLPQRANAAGSNSAVRRQRSSARSPASANLGRHERRSRAERESERNEAEHRGACSPSALNFASAARRHPAVICAGVRRANRGL